MLIAEYSYETDVAVQKKEAARIAFADGEKRGIALGEKRGRKEGAYQKALETALLMKSKNYDIDEIASMTGLSIKEIEEL